jgi:UDPglucose 6-dehydrogenase
MQIAIVGAGYVDLVSAACFADFGHSVICIDKEADKVSALTRGVIPICEPALDSLVRANVDAGRITLQSRLKNLCARRSVHCCRHAIAARRWSCGSRLII